MATSQANQQSVRWFFTDFQFPILTGTHPVCGQALVEGARGFSVVVCVAEKDLEGAFFFGHLVPRQNVAINIIR